MAALSRSPFRTPLYWVAFGAGLVWTVAMWIRAAPFASVLDDEVGHFLVARDSWVHPQLLLNAWGRVGTTLAFVLPAAVSLQVARGAALAMSAATVLVATAVARRLGVRTLALVPAFLWFQPWFHFYGSAVVTEVPFSLALIGACWAALADRFLIASVLFGLLPLIRHEGIALLALWIAFLIVRRRWGLIALSVLPLLAYQVAFSLVFHVRLFAIYLHKTARASYGHGGWLHYVLPLGRSIGPVVALLALAGIVARRRDLRFAAFAAPFVLLVLVETVIFRLGLFGSGGNVDYLLPVATFAAVSAGFGGDLALKLAPTRFLLAPAVIAAVLALAAGVYALRTKPAHADAAARPMHAAVRFLHARRQDAGSVTATHVWFFEMSGASIPSSDGLHSPWSRPPRPSRIAAGSPVVWDCFYSGRFGLSWKKLRRAGFGQLASFGGGRVVILRRDGGQGTGGALRGMTIRRPRCR